MEISPITQSAIVLAMVSGAVIYLAQSGFLGPYGTPGDTLHLIMLISVVFFTWMIFAYTVLRGNEG